MFMQNQCDPKAVAKYIGRYLGRPAIAASRIDQYDEETVPAMEFIQRLIRHIPEKHFKMLRYGGLHARHRDSDRQLNHTISREKHKFFLSLDKWRACILSSFGYDPLECPECGKTMLFMEFYYNHQRVPLEKLYEKAMSKAHRKRSPA